MKYNSDEFKEILSNENLKSVFPPERSNAFFDALFGDASEGAYDIQLTYREIKGNKLEMELRLNQRPDCCLACNLTYGLPQVFSRHPIIDISGTVKGIDNLLGNKAHCGAWTLGTTEQLSTALHIVPLHIELS